MPVTFTFNCPLPNGFHARPASHLAAVAQEFACACGLTNTRSGATADIKSVLSIIAADIRMNDKCSVSILGADEQNACTALRRFVENDLAACDVPLPDLLTDAGKRELPRALGSLQSKVFFGLPASRGIAQGKAVILGNMELAAGLDFAKSQDAAREEKQIKGAVAAVRNRIQKRLLEQPSATEAGVLRAHLAMLGDAALADKLLEQVAQGCSAAQAIVEANKFFTALLRRSENPYIRERAIDVEGIFLELLGNVSFSTTRAATELREPSIVIAENLTPQQLLAFDRRWLRGVAVESAGTTSHTMILTRSLAIPALAGVKEAHSLRPGAEVLLDANRGFLLADPAPSARKFYERECRTSQKREAALARYAKNPARTRDGTAIAVAANVSCAEEVELVFASGADGIGVFRTEMLFLGRDHPPTEEEQFQIYAEAVRVASGKPVVIRTIDVGGDKPLAYIKMPPEVNPFLGNRGMRLYPEHPELLRAQLRAILRASALGPIQLLVPMVSTLDEVLWFKQQLAAEQQELQARQIAFDRFVSLGIMVEVPSVAFMLEQLCQEVDFFSIGTNDLSQYFFAADRGHSKVAQLANVRHPGFLKFLEQIVVGVGMHGKSANVCGDMAADMRNLPLLLGLGVHEISTPGSEIAGIKRHIAGLSAPECQKLLSEALACRTGEDVESLLDRRQMAPGRSLLDRELILVSDEIDSKEEAIREIIDAFYVEGRTDDPDRLEEAVWQRESVYSTGMDYGFAIPHCKSDAVSSGSIGVLKLGKPVVWDGRTVQMVILLAARESGANNEHLRVFSRLARNLMDEDFREQLLKAEDRDAILTVLKKEFEPLPRRGGP